MASDRTTVGRNGFPGGKILVYAAIFLGAIVLLCAGVLILMPDALLRGFVAQQVTKGFALSHPGSSLQVSGLHFDFVRNRVTCDSVVMSRTDSSFTCRIDSLSVSGIRWLTLLAGKGFEPGALSGSVVEAGSLEMSFLPSGYGLRCGPVRLSVPDSEIVARAAEFRPSMGDEEYFGESRFSKTRIDLAARECRVSGLSCVDVLRGGNLRARSITIRDAIVDVLINKDKPPGSDDAGPLMPAEILSSIKDTIGLDSLILAGGRLGYAERMVSGRKPAILTFDELQVAVTGIASHPPPDTETNIRAAGVLANGGKLTILMSIPLSSERCSFRYSGTLSEMKLSSLNTFIEASDAMRIKSGRLSSAAFDIGVREGSATGHVHAEYADLIIASIDGRTGSEEGVMDRYASWISKNVKIRGSNTPDGSGAMKIGTVKYARKTSDPFLGFTWFALRSGVGDVVGF